MTRSASPAEFTPALGHRSLTGLYDAAIALMTRETVWRAALVAQLAPRDGETIVDVGCGTGTLATLIKAAAPGADMIGIDPDPEVLDRARSKALSRGADVDFLQGFAGDVAELIGRDRADKVVSSLVFHQAPIVGKRAGLASIHAALRPGRGAAHRRLWLAAPAVDAASLPPGPGPKRGREHPAERRRRPARPDRRGRVRARRGASGDRHRHRLDLPVSGQEAAGPLFPAEPGDRACLT